LRKLLLKCILSEGEVSREAFARWEGSVVFDDLDFEAFKLLPAVYLKCLRYQWQSPFLLRIKGAYRRTWTENQLLLAHLHDLLSALTDSQIEFLVADETLRLTHICNDLGIYSLQHFSLAAPFRVKKNFDQILFDSGWESIEKGTELTFSQKEKVSNLRIYWLGDAEFETQIKIAGNVLIKDISRPTLSLERQIINLCEKEFISCREEQSRWQYITSEFLNRETLDHPKLASIARQRSVAHHLADMFKSLKEDFEVDIDEGLIVELRRSSLNRPPSLRRKIANLWQSYRTLRKHGNSEISFREFLAQRWEADSNTNLLKHAAKAGMRSLQSK